MSDALTDIGRDEERGANFYAYLESVKQYLLNPTKANLAEVIKAAGKTDAVQGGYWSGKTNLRKNLEESLAELRANDKKVWTKFLSMLLENEHPMLQEFKAMSPFKDKMLIFVDYGCGFVHLKGELQSMLDRYISRDKNMKIYDGDKYLVALPMPTVEKTEVEWVHCGYLGAKGPRKADETK